MINQILSHRSIRKFKKKEIPPELMNKILHAGTRASTTGNMQVYSIVVTTKQELKEKLWEAHFRQDMVLQAPVHLTFCADFNRFSLWCKARKAEPGYDNYLSFFTAAIDALLVSQNVCLAAEAEGLGICYLGTATYNADQIVEILELPKLVVPVAAIVLGYPDEQPELTDRLPVEGVIHSEKYKNYGQPDIDRIHHEKENLAQTLELLKINGKESLAQIFTDNRYTKKDNIFFSKKFMKTITDQGFMNND
jgi:nitroreductase